MNDHFTEQAIRALIEGQARVEAKLDTALKQTAENANRIGKVETRITWVTGVAVAAGAIFSFTVMVGLHVLPVITS